MKTYINKNWISFIEIILSIALFSQLIITVWASTIYILKYNKINKDSHYVNFEIYNILINWIWSYIRRATWVMYDSHKNKVWTLMNIKQWEDPFGRHCEDNDKLNNNKFDRLTIYLDKEKKTYINFAVEHDVWKWTSRLVYKKNDSNWFYLNSEDTYITCFLVSVPDNPYWINKHKNLKDIQSYVQLYIAWKYRYSWPQIDSFSDKITSVTYKTTFTLRNYYY